MNYDLTHMEVEVRIGTKILEFHRDGIISTDSSPFKMYQVAHTPTVTSHILLVLGGVGRLVRKWSMCLAQNGFLDGFFVCAKLGVVFCWMELLT